MNIRQLTKVASVLTIVTLIVGLSVYNPIGQLVVAAPPEMEDIKREVSHWRRYSSDGAIRFPVWSVNARWL